MSTLEDPQAQWVSMVMARVQKLEEQQQEQKQTIQKLREQYHDQLLLCPKNPLQLLASAFRLLMGTKTGAEDLQVIYLPTDEKGVGPCCSVHCFSFPSSSFFFDNSAFGQGFVPFAGRRVFYIYRKPGRTQQIEIEQIDQGPSGECALDKLPGIHTFKEFDLACMDGCSGWRMASFCFTTGWGEPMQEWLADHVTDGMLADPEDYSTSGSE